MEEAEDEYETIPSPEFRDLRFGGKTLQRTFFDPLEKLDLYLCPGRLQKIKMETCPLYAYESWDRDFTRQLSERFVRRFLHR